MIVQHPGLNTRSSGNKAGETDFETKLRTAFDIALIVAMLVAPFLIAGLQTDDPQQLAAGNAAIAQMTASALAGQTTAP